MYILTHAYIRRYNEKRLLRVVSVDRCAVYIIYRVSQNMMDKPCVFLLYTPATTEFFVY